MIEGSVPTEGRQVAVHGVAGAGLITRRPCRRRGGGGAGVTRVGENTTVERRHLQNLVDDWAGGTAAAQAQKQGGDLLTDQAAYQQKLADLGSMLSTGATTLGASRSDLQKAVDAAEQWWNVADDGTVRPGVVLAAWAALNDVNWFTVENQRIAVEQNIRLILAQFQAIDEALANDIRTLGWK